MKRYEATRLYITLHSYGPLMLYPWGFDGVNIDNYLQHREAAKLAADAIYAINGTQYTIANSIEVLYISSGASKDYAAGPGGIDLSLTIELPGGGNSGFDLPPSRIDAVVTETFVGLREFGKYVSATWGNSEDKDEGDDN